MRNLKFSLIQAHMTNETRHAVVVMRSLGIGYTLAVPQSLGDAWWFLGCTDVPETLPSFLTDMPVDDFTKLIGYGLTEDEANMFNGMRTDD